MIQLLCAARQWTNITRGTVLPRDIAVDHKLPNNKQLTKVETSK